MPTEVVVPEVGEGGVEVTLVRWLKHEGELVREGEIIFELDTQKATLEVEAVATGLVRDIRVREGEVVQPRQLVAMILGPGEVLEPVAVPPRAVSASPKARRLASERGIDLGGIRGTGPDGMVTEHDLDFGAPTTGDPSRTRSAVAQRTIESWRTIPHFYLTLRADMTEGLKRARPTPLICHGVVRALKEHPECNVAWESDRVVPRTSIHLGLLVDTPNGLLLPRVENADALALPELGAALEAATQRARAGRLSSSDAGPRSVTISNLGMFSVDSFAGVIPTPDVLLLAVGRVRAVPVLQGEAWVPRQVVDLTLSVDHRALSGAAGARFLTTLERMLAEGEVRA